MDWEIEFYDSVGEELAKMPPKIQARMIRLMELMEKHSDRFLFWIDVFLEKHLVSVTSEASYWRKVLGKLRPETAIKIGCSNIENITSSVGTARN